MKRWQIVFLATLWLLGGSSLWASELGETVQDIMVPQWSIDLNLGYFSPYMGGSTGQTIYDDEVTQGKVTLSYKPWSAYALLWFSYSPDGGFNEDWGDEVDYVIGYAPGFGKWRFDIHYARYNLIDLESGRADINAVCAFASYTGIVEPYVGIDGNIPVDKEVLEGGWTWKLGVKKAFDLGAGFVFSPDLYMTGNDGAFGFEPELLSVVGLKGSLSWQATAALSFCADLGYQYSPDQEAEKSITEDEKVFGSLSFSYSFPF